MAVTSYGRNKNHDDEIKKNQEKANNSPSYRCAAINNRLNIGRIALERLVGALTNCSLLQSGVGSGAKWTKKWASNNNIRG